MNEKYSYKDFLQKSLTETDPKEWDGTEVIGSCFAQETPNTTVFPAITGVKFIKCNLDNCVIPKDCTVEGGTNKLIQVQNDGEDWILDTSLNPVEPVDKARFLRFKLSVLPADIPATKPSLSVTQTAEKAITDKLATDIKALQDAAAVSLKGG